MNCADHQRNIEPYIRSELLPSNARFLEEHLESCTSCKREFEDFKIILGSLTGLPKPHYDLPKNLIANAIKTGSASPKRRRSPSRRSPKRKSPIPYIVIPVAILVALTLLWTLKKSPPQEKTPKKNPRLTPPPSTSINAPPQTVAKRDKVNSPHSDKGGETGVPGTPKKSPLKPDDVIAKIEKKTPISVFPEPSQVSPKPSQVSPKPSQVSPDPNKTEAPKKREAVVIAQIVGGKERVVGYLGSSIHSKQVLKTRPGQAGVCITMNGATIFLGGDSRATFSGGAIRLEEGELLLDQRDIEKGSLTLASGAFRLESGAGNRILLMKKAKERLTVLNGSARVFGMVLELGRSFDLKGKKLVPGRFEREPRWVRKMRGKRVVLFSLKEDFTAKKWKWGSGKKETIRGRTLLKIGPGAGTASYKFGSSREAVPYLCRFYKGTFIEFHGVAERDCSVQLRVFDHTRQDNYDKVVSLKAGKRRQIVLNLEDFIAVDQSGIPLGDGHVITGLSFILKRAKIDPGLRIIDYRIVRIP